MKKKSLDLRKTKQDTYPAVPLGFGQMPRNYTYLVCQVQKNLIMREKSRQVSQGQIFATIKCKPLCLTE